IVYERAALKVFFYRGSHDGNCWPLFGSAQRVGGRNGSPTHAICRSREHGGDWGKRQTGCDCPARPHAFGVSVLIALVSQRNSCWRPSVRNRNSSPERAQSSV